MSSSRSSNAQWKKFEKQVAEVYRELGATEIECDKDIDGHQIDVFAIVPLPDGTYSRNIISCKCYGRLAGVGEVKELNQVFLALRHNNKADIAVLVSNVGFSRQAKSAAESLGIRLRTIEQLQWANVDLLPYLRATRAKFQEEPVFEQNLFVPLRCRVEGRPQEQSLHSIAKSFALSAKCSLLTVLGGFGAGKTTSCKALFQELATEYLESGNPPIPIYLNLREYRGQLNLKGFILDVLVNQHDCRCPNFAAFRRLLVDGRVLLLLDAFDEMASRVSYAETLRNFTEICSVLEGKAKAILTCRTHFFKNSEEVHEVHEGTELYAISKRNRYTIVDLRPFQPKQIKAYVKSACGDRWEEAYQQIEQTYDLMGLAKTPILLEMITRVLPELHSSGEPINSLGLYAHYVKNWLRRDDWRVQLTAQQRRDFTIAFADSMYTREAIQFTWSDVQEAIRRKFPGVPASQLTEYSNDIQICSFIKREDNALKFAHESFMEYFISTQLYEDIIKNDNERLCSRRYSAEILAFLSQHFATHEVRQNLRNWLASSNNDTLVANTMVLLATWEKQLSGAFRNIQLFNHLVVSAQAVDCAFSSIHVKKVTWQTVDWKGVSSTKGRWDQCSWVKSTLSKVAFEKDDLDKASFGHSYINDLRFIDCNLAESKFIDCAVLNLRFDKSELTSCEIDGDGAEVSFYNTQIFGCDMHGLNGRAEQCKINNSNLSNVAMSSLIGTTLCNCEITNVAWPASALENAVFENVKFDRFGILEAVHDKTPARIWKAPPRFIRTRGLDRKTKAQLMNLGAEFEEKKKK